MELNTLKRMGNLREIFNWILRFWESLAEQISINWALSGFYMISGVVAMVREEDFLQQTLKTSNCVLGRQSTSSPSTWTYICDERTDFFVK